MEEINKLNELLGTNLKEEDKLEMTKYSNGYGWKISVHGKNMEELIDKIKETNTKMREITENVE